MKICLLFLIFINSAFFSFCFAQESSAKFFGNVSSGIQISGIKKEDFISSNVSPLLDVSLGRWFSNEIGFSLGYRGTYFKLITDEENHRYDFWYVDTFLNLSKMFSNSDFSNHSILATIGTGYFFRHEYNRPNVCAKLGLIYKYDIDDNFSFQSGFSSVVGWDIYQGDDDILPGFQLGLSYYFN
ncbi:hypothetical protein [Algoriphagus taiwanensis]|uniref:Outer membrane protein beta-barrel domain-containing protein n=1 Tax=Algoriphagus taiwanensis TaxID=1445656 RepID=A0ABQ6Q2U0_9BACT|nr:hypothetical protein Ataiwa_27670 [Algoriphagus taiwanensis]